MIHRLATSLVRKLARQFPAVLILGPRQCGKTTLARTFLKGDYFDLERPSDRQVFEDPELALSRFTGPLILDEAQTLPELFPILRSAIDRERKRCGRFFLLGSVNPALLRQISESLAGRVGIVELAPFLWPEARRLKMDLETHWWRGGFPDACRARTDEQRMRWQENYVRTFVERDIPRDGLSIPPQQIRRLTGMLAHLHGGLLNASDLGRSLGLSYHTVQRYLDLLEGHYLVRRLPPYWANLGKRLVRSPKVYLRDSGLLHYLLGIRCARDLWEFPRRGASWEGFLIEELIAREQLQRAGTQFYFFRTHAGAEIDLLLLRDRERVGYEFKCSASVERGDWRGLQGGLDDGMIDRGVVVYAGDRDFSAGERVEVRSARSLLEEV